MSISKLTPLEQIEILEHELTVALTELDPFIKILSENSNARKTMSSIAVTLVGCRIQLNILARTLGVRK